MEAKIAKILKYEGLLVAPLTGFNEKGEVNLDIIPDYIDLLKKQGVTGAFVNGSTGEGPSLTVSERKKTAEKWVWSARGKLELVIIQIGGANSICDVHELAKHAESIGADGISVLPPLYYKPRNDEELMEYLKSVSSAAPSTPLLYYHIPGFTGVDVRLDKFLPQVKKSVPALCGAKSSTTNLTDLPGLLSQRKDFKIFQGCEEVLLGALSLGVNAAIGATYNFMGRTASNIISYYKKGDYESAYREQKLIKDAVDVTLKYGHLMSSFKATMNGLTPLNFGRPRLPLCSISDSDAAALVRELKELGLENIN